MKKLIEEIYKKSADFFGRQVVYPEIRASEDDKQRFVMGLIIHITQAILSGKYPGLDETLGIIGRYEIHDGILTIEIEKENEDT